MKKFLLLSMCVTFLFAKNPDVYSALGDVIYNNAADIKKLKNIEQFDLYDDKISTYLKSVKKTKELGYKIEKGDQKADKREYLSSLRTLSKDNDFFVRQANQEFQSSIEKEDSELFSQMINTGLIDLKSKKQEIVDYYFTHQEDINASGAIEKILEDDAKLKAKKEAQQKRIKSKKERELANIKRIREKDKREQEALERKLQLELDEKKRKLREEQKRELLKTR